MAELKVSTYETSPDHVYNPKDREFPMDLPRITIIHWHSMIVTCRGQVHGVFIPADT